MNIAENIRKLIADYKIEDALEKLILFGKDNTEYQQEITLINSRYNKLKNDTRLNLKNQNDIEVGFDRICFSILEFINAVEKGEHLGVGSKNRNQKIINSGRIKNQINIDENHGPIIL